MSPSSPKSLPQKVFSLGGKLGFVGTPPDGYGGPLRISKNFVDILLEFAGILTLLDFLQTRSHHRSMWAKVSHKNTRARSRTGDLAGVARNLARGNPRARSRRVEVQGRSRSLHAARGNEHMLLFLMGRW